MEFGTGPTMKIPLGISVESKPTFGDLFDRAKRRVSLMAAGQESLEYIVNEVFILGARIEIKDGKFELDAKIQIKPQIDFFGHQAGGGRGRASDLSRQDDDEQKAVDETAAAVGNSARLLDRVAEAMGTSTNLAVELRNMERKEGVDTQPARRFIYLKQEEFVVDVEDEHILFKSHVVRTAVADVEPVSVVMTLVESRSDSVVARGLINVTQGGSTSAGVRSGGTHEFRFVHLEGWQKTVLEAARWLKLPIRLKAVETISTCSLEQRPVDVHQVHNWLELLENTYIELGRILNDSNAGRVEELRDAA